MKYTVLAISLILPFISFSQKIEKFYNYKWQPCDVSYARFYSVIEPKDSLWECNDYFIHESALQMSGFYKDSTCKIAHGTFYYYHPNRKLASFGKYNNGKKEGVWLFYYDNGMIKDSIFYDAGRIKGTMLTWHKNGYIRDSAIRNLDGSGVHISWFDNGNPSYAGYYATGNKKHGTWNYFHRNGKLAAKEVYDNGTLLNKQYFNEAGEAEDTTSKDRPAEFKGGLTAWKKYLEKNLYFPDGYTIQNADKAVVVVSAVIDENGRVTDVEIATPFHEVFNTIALKVMKFSPDWIPAISDNRKVRYAIKQEITFAQE